MDTQVLVVGAGPTGLLLGAELRRRGIDCLLIDSLEGPRHWDRATIVHPRSMEVFASLGIAARFLERGVKQRTIRLHSDGEVLGEMDLGTCGSPFGFNLNLSEEVTESILYDYLRSRGGSVQRDSRLVELDNNSGEVVATVERGGERRHVSAEFVVGCDGLHSPTRELSEIAFEGHDIPEPWAVFDVTLGGWANDFDANLAYLERTTVILTPLPGLRWRVYLRPSSPTSDLVEDAAAVIGRYEPGATLLDVSDQARFHCHTKVAERYRAGRVLLAGDAAHVCTPAQGHGMNSGLQDAFNLAWKLALVCDGAADPALLDSYEAERRPVALAVTASGDAFEGMQGLSEAALRKARDGQLREVFADPDSRHGEVIAEVELDISYSGSPIVQGATSAVIGAGERLPDVGLLRAPGGAAGHLHALAHGGGAHTLLVLGGPSVDGDRLARLLGRLQKGIAGLGLFESAVALGTDAGSPEPIGLLAPQVAEELGVQGATILAVRPDGHIGLSYDGEDIAVVLGYAALIESGGGAAASAATP